MTYLDILKQVEDATKAVEIILDIMGLATDVAFDMWIDEKEKATSMKEWQIPAMIKVLDMEVEE